MAVKLRTPALGHTPAPPRCATPTAQLFPPPSRTSPFLPIRMQEMPRLILIGLVCAQGWALTVNRLNGGGTLIYVDFSLPGGVVPLELVRSYNSLTALTEPTGWLGMFGWGWTSPLETFLTVTPDRGVLLRDGGSGNILAFKPQSDAGQARSELLQRLKKPFLEARLGRKLTDADAARMEWPATALKQLEADASYRAQLARKYKIALPLTGGQVLVSKTYGYETLQLEKNGSWKRQKDGLTQTFDKNGRLTGQLDRSGFEISLKYSGKQLAEVSDRNRLHTLKFTFARDRVMEVADNRGDRARYIYDDTGNLTRVTDSKSHVFAFRYENKKFPHLLSRIDYVSEGAKTPPYREIRYDENGLVVFHRDKEGTETQYEYGKNPANPEFQFWTKTLVKNGTQTREEYDEYLVKARDEGGKYLFRQEKKRANETEVTLFNECCGQPLTVTKNNQVTSLKYYDNGLLKERVGPTEDLRVEYDPRWNKISQVRINGALSRYKYDGQGNLVEGSDSMGSKVTLTYDAVGHISTLGDNQGKLLSISYGPLGKPETISEKLGGTVRITYDATGKITRATVLTPKGSGRTPAFGKSQVVVTQILKMFQGLLGVLRPAGIASSGL